MSLSDLTPSDLAEFDQRQAEITETWQARGLDLTGRKDEEIVAVRSAMLTLEVLSERAVRYGSWEAAFTETLALIRAAGFPKEDGFIH